VVLEPGGEERLLPVEETLAWLTAHLDGLVDPPDDLARLGGSRARAERLLETACELELEPGYTIQWFAVRLEPPLS
jgi:hypothetical protein